MHGGVDVDRRQDREDERLQEAHEDLETGHRDQQQERERQDHDGDLRREERGAQRPVIVAILSFLQFLIARDRKRPA